MDTGKLKTFAQSARRQLLDQVAVRLEQVLRADTIETREKEAAILELKGQIAQSGRPAVVDRVAYTWFNRFCALRFMDVNRYTRLGIVSPIAGYSQPEILQEAKQGVIDLEFRVDRQRVLDILSGRTPSSDPQGEAYRLLLVSACNAYHQQMPFLFEPIEDYTELLMPDDLLSENSVLAQLRQVLIVENCQDVEVIGWLYQFYISERKDEVFENLKNNIKIEAKDIPAATQLFTPHWIVRYLVENSLGRLWMLNNPNSKLIEQMDYYIRPVQEEIDFLVIRSPEEIKICDTACGSGHMLTYAFDLLYAIYAECGYDPVEIPRLILEKNLFGIEIDPRAGALASFALFMKARAKDRRFFSRPVQPNICVLENVTFTQQELDEYMLAVGRDLFTAPLQETLRQFEQVNNYGSLICPPLSDVGYVRSMLDAKNLGGNLFLYGIQQRVIRVLHQAEYLAKRYHVVVTNPPYMNSIGMNEKLRLFLNDNYQDVKTDLFSAFMVRCIKYAVHSGKIGCVVPYGWMFLSSYEKLRGKILSETTIFSLVKPSYHSFFTSAIVSLVAFILGNCIENIEGVYFDLGYLGSAELQPLKLREAILNNESTMRYSILSEEFRKIPGFPIAYWVSPKIREIFYNSLTLENFAELKTGMQTGDNNKFLRLWSEVEESNITKLANLKENKRWYLYSKGGDYRKWYGNVDYVVDWDNDGEEIKNYSVNGSLRSRVRDVSMYFREAISWSFVSSSYFGGRYKDPGVYFDVASSSIFPKTADIFWILSFLCSKLASTFIKILNPTANYQVENVSSLPIIHKQSSDIINNAKELVKISRLDWNFFEIARDFTEFPLLQVEFRNSLFAEAYTKLLIYWKELTTKMKSLEEENNRMFIDIYNLVDELTPDVPIKEITLSCNPYNRYGGKKSSEELEILLLEDTVKEYISYSVGCMFGRYSLDKPGLILANHGETARDYLRQIPQPTFPPDEDNVIPILEAGWFQDDIAERFKKFLRLTFGDEHYEENLAFIENAIGRDIRSYFLKEFYSEHLKMYKNRPIYWLFSSPSGAFNALIYMHRYQPDQVSVVLNNYLREYTRKLNAHKAHLEQVSIRMGGSQAEKTKATKEINALNKVLAELKEYEDEVLYPLATRQIQIDLDDGVKVNYKKFGLALKPVKGLSD